MLVPCGVKVPCTVPRGKGAERPLTYPVRTGKERPMNGILKRLVGVLVLILILISSTTSGATDVASDKKATFSAPGISEELAPPLASSLKDYNLAIFARGMWLVLRYDAQARSLVATGSDKDGAALWYARSVDVSEDTSLDTFTLKAMAVLKLGSATWVDWQQFQIVIDSSNHATITKTNPNGTKVYKGKAIRIKTYTGSDG
jgi:hypothetical protein